MHKLLINVSPGPVCTLVYSTDSHINLNRKSGSCTQFGIYCSIWNEAFQYLYNKTFLGLGNGIPDCAFFLKILSGPTGTVLKQIKCIIMRQYKKKKNLVNLIAVWSVIMSGQFPVCVLHPYLTQTTVEPETLFHFML